MKNDWKILVIDDNEDILVSLRLLLKPYISLIHVNTHPEEIPNFLKANDYDVILLDMNFTKDAISGSEGFEHLKQIQKIDKDAIVIFITAYGDAEKAVKAIRAGATDFIIKPWDNNKLIGTISSAVELKRSKKAEASHKLKQEALSNEIATKFSDFLGESKPMKQIFKTIEKVAPTDANILVLGENGTGKELVARALHQNSLRKDEVFIRVDVGTLQETLFESELFGHVKGAFTDAKTDKMGRFEIASGGTIFLDEIGNLSLAMQAKLLTAIETREIIRVGSTKPIPIDIRLICATNANLNDLVENGQFREDLYYRINTIETHLPPLRARGDDVELISMFYVRKFADRYLKKINGISSSCLQMLIDYNWPGNVRELRHCIERAVIMCEGSVISEQDCLFSQKTKAKNKFNFENMTLDEIEKITIKTSIEKHSGNLTKVAKELGLTRPSLYRRLEKHGL